jgi:hypothetical protein
MITKIRHGRFCELVKTVHESWGLFTIHQSVCLLPNLPRVAKAINPVVDDHQWPP